MDQGLPEFGRRNVMTYHFASHNARRTRGHVRPRHFHPAKRRTSAAPTNTIPESAVIQKLVERRASVLRRLVRARARPKARRRAVGPRPPLSPAPHHETALGIKTFRDKSA